MYVFPFSVSLRPIRHRFWRFRPSHGHLRLAPSNDASMVRRSENGASGACARKTSFSLHLCPRRRRVHSEEARRCKKRIRTSHFRVGRRLRMAAIDERRAAVLGRRCLASSSVNTAGRISELRIFGTRQGGKSSSIRPISLLRYCLFQYSGPDVKWVDGGRPLFRVLSRLASTVLTRDLNLQTFFNNCQRLKDNGTLADAGSPDRTKVSQGIDCWAWLS